MNAVILFAYFLAVHETGVSQAPLSQEMLVVEEFIDQYDFFGTLSQILSILYVFLLLGS